MNNCTRKCIHSPVCEQRHYNFDHCEFCEEERPHGQWIRNEDGNYECSECGIAWKDMSVQDTKPVFKACPWCGADMRSEEGEEK